MGGATEYADTRTAFDELPEELKEELLANDYVACHSLYHSRKTAAPGFLPGINPEDHFMSRHKLIQRTFPLIPTLGMPFQTKHPRLIEIPLQATSPAAA